MDTTEHVIELLREGNPVRDRSAISVELDARSYLAMIEQRRTTMIDLDTGRPASRTVRRRPRGRWLAAAAVVTLLVIGFLQGGSGPRVHTAGTIPGPQLAVIEEWSRTYNQGDVERHLALFTEDAVIDSLLIRLDGEAFARGLEWESSWDPLISLSECTQPRVNVVGCTYSASTDFLAPVGLTLHGTLEFGLDPDEDYLIARASFRSDNPDLDRFWVEFEAWAEAAHPEVSLTGPNPDREREVWIDLRDEFLAQSEEFPQP